MSITIRELKNTALQIANIKQKDAIEMLCEQLERWSELTTNTFKLIDAIWRELFQETSPLMLSLLPNVIHCYQIFTFSSAKISILTIHAC